MPLFLPPAAQHDGFRAGQAASHLAAPLRRQQGRKDPEERALAVPGSQHEALM